MCPARRCASHLHTRAAHTIGLHTRCTTPPADVAWAHNGRYLATASDDTTLRVWDAATGACLRELRGHTHYVFCCAFSSGDNMLVSV